MKNLNGWAVSRQATAIIAGGVVLLGAGVGLSGCASLLPKAVAAPTLYALQAAEANSTAISTMPSAISATPRAAATLVVNTPRASAGFDSQHIMYIREPYKLEYFAHNEWIDTPARMLHPMIVSSVGKAGAFKAVVPASIGATGELTLDTEIARLQQDFSTRPSRVVFTMRAYLLDSQNRKTIAWRELETVVAAQSDDPIGGVLAANRAVQMALTQITDFCLQAETQWRAARSGAASFAQ